MRTFRENGYARKADVNTARADLWPDYGVQQDGTTGRWLDDAKARGLEAIPNSIQGGGGEKLSFGDSTPAAPTTSLSHPSK